MEKRVISLTFDNGVLVDTKTAIISDAQLAAEALAKEMNDSHVQLLAYLAKWDSVTTAQAKDILKHLVRYRLWKEGQL